VTNEGRLPVVVDIRIGDGDPVTAVSDINQTIIVVLIVGEIGGDIDVINPDVVRCLDSNGITVCCKNLGDGDVSENHILNTVDVKPNANNL
jgi:hypothetical protein